jgi:outer membrane protein
MKKFILMAAIGIMMSLAASAQKHGYVFVQELMAALPQVEKAQKDLMAFAKTYEDALASMDKERTTKMAAYEKEFKTMSDAVKEARASEIQALEKRMMEYQQSSERKIEDKQAEVMKPIYENVNKAIKEYAQANGYDYVYTAEAILYAKDSDNLTNALILKMGGKPKSAAGSATPK